MTVNSTTSRVSYAGNGSTTAFAVSFYFLANADLVVIKTSSTGTQTTLVLNTDYTVSGAGNPSGGTVTCTTAPAAGESLVIFRDPAATQLTDYQANDPFPAETHERALDKLTMLVQRSKDLINRSFTLSDGDTSGASTQLPIPTANNVIGWNAAATGLQNVTPQTLATIVSSAQTYADIFTGTGAQTNFTLSNNPGALYNMDVSVGGVTQLPNTDYTWVSGTTLTFTTAPPNGAKVLVRYSQALPDGTTDSASVNFVQTGTGAVTSSVQSKLRNGIDVCVFDFMTSAQIAAVQAYTLTTDVTAACQAAMDAAYASKRNLFFPAGGYLVTGLTIPGDVQTGIVDDRDKGFRIYGQGFGEPFVHTNTGGTVIKSVTNAPVIQDILGTAVSSNGTVEIDHIRFDGTSTTPVVLLQSFYGVSSFHHCVIYQRGTGDGFKTTYGAGWHVHDCYVMNRDWATSGLTTSRTGIGFNCPITYDGGLMSIRKSTARGFLTGFSIGGGAGVWYSPSIYDCECSITYNGIKLLGTRSAIVQGCYLEGGDGGTGVLDQGEYSSIRDSMIFAGYAVGIDASSTTTKGTEIQRNVVAIGATVNGIGIDVASSAAFGGYNKNVINNSVIYTAGTNGVNGIKISGTDPRITVLGNMFDPRGNWTGTNTKKINDASSNGSYGIVQAQLGDLEVPVLSRGAITVEQGPSALTQSNVSANVLTIPTVGSYFVCNATSACTVQQISAGVTPGRIVVFRTDTANMTFQDTAYIFLNGNFTGPGTLTLMIDRIGAANYAYEIARTVF